jgi:hypothetical protein
MSERRLNLSSTAPGSKSERDGQRRDYLAIAFTSRLKFLSFGTGNEISRHNITSTSNITPNGVLQRLCRPCCLVFDLHHQDICWLIEGDEIRRTYFTARYENASFSGQLFWSLILGHHPNDCGTNRTLRLSSVTTKFAAVTSNVLVKPKQPKENISTSWMLCLLQFFLRRD